MPNECSPLELRAHVALLGAPGNVLAEGNLAKALGRVSKAERTKVLSALEARGMVLVEAARRGRRVRLTDRGRASSLGDLRVPARARFSGALVNTILGHVPVAQPPTSSADLGARPATLSVGVHEAEADSSGTRVLAAHARLARGPGGSADMASLREALPGMSRQELDGTLVALDREGLVSLGRPVDLAALDARQREAALLDPARGMLVYVSRVSPIPVPATTEAHP